MKQESRNVHATETSEQAITILENSLVTGYQAIQPTYRQLQVQVPPTSEYPRTMVNLANTEHPKQEPKLGTLA